MTSLLEVRRLQAGYGFPVVLGVDFDVEAGETAVLFGLNGAGKTTTVSTVAGLLPVDGGTIRFDGEDVTGLATADLVDRGIVLVPEGRRVFPSLPVHANLRLGAWSRRQDKGAYDARLRQVHDYFPVLEQRANQPAGTLSGGEQQMLAIGRALMSGPRLLLLDEASLGLSPAMTKSVFRVVNRINEDGITVLMVEQNAGVLPYADRVLVMEKGTMVFEGVGEEAQQADLRERYLGGVA